MLTKRRITVGVSGGIAAYKAAELVRLLVKDGAEVQVVMTRAAERFITPLTLQALSGRPVGGELFDLDAESRIGHIRVADESELLVIAPATADVIARLAMGLADDLLATVALATKAPLLVAPAMNVNMWQHPQTQANVARLVEHGARLVGPDSGELACGWVGSGRMAEPAQIVAACHLVLGEPRAVATPRARDLEGRRLLVSAGPTHEALDPVRYLGNQSSGKMGFAVARRAALRGAQVTLVAGPVVLSTPPGVERIEVETARQMREALVARDADADAIVMAAAVADFRPAEASAEKIKKTDNPPGAPALTLHLEKNPDILAELSARRRARVASTPTTTPTRRPLLVGFAAETSALDTHAAAKLARKDCDLLVGNDVTAAGSGFGTDTNQVVLYAPYAAPERLPLLAKDDVADRILDWLAARLSPTV